MGRLFFKLYLIIVLANVFFLIGLLNSEDLLNNTYEKHYENLSQGSHLLLQEFFTALPESEWAAMLAEINQGDGYPIKLIPFSSLGFSSLKMERIKAGAVVLAKVHGAKYVYKRLGESQNVIELPFEQSKYQHQQRLINSTFNLIEKRIAEQPSIHWSEALEQLNRQFSFPIQIIQQHQEKALSNKAQSLENREVIIIDSYHEPLIAYRRINNSTDILRLGPFERPLTIKYLIMILALVFSLTVGLAVLFWVYPLWRDLNQLGASTKAFGRGGFCERVTPRRGSVLHNLADSFNDMANRIQSLISSHKELTNAVSHELRTPIARLRFGMEMLRESTQETDRVRFMDGMNADIDNLDQLVEELLTYARFDRDKPDIVFQRQLVFPWLREVVRQASIGSEKPTIEFEIYTVALNYARFDPVLMARALGNLLQNAKRYACNRIKVVFSTDKGYYQLIVDDDGEGIPESQREAIFNAFTRLDVSRDRGTGGFGLGLAIAQRISHWHGGRIGISDSPLGGARFIISWPQENPVSENK